LKLIKFVLLAPISLKMLCHSIEVKKYLDLEESVEITPEELVFYHRKGRAPVSELKNKVIRKRIIDDFGDRLSYLHWSLTKSLSDVSYFLSKDIDWHPNDTPVDRYQRDCGLSIAFQNSQSRLTLQVKETLEKLESILKLHSLY
jgi:hypothetical protein